MHLKSITSVRPDLDKSRRAFDTLLLPYETTITHSQPVSGATIFDSLTRTRPKCTPAHVA